MGLYHSKVLTRTGTQTDFQIRKAHCCVKMHWKEGSRNKRRSQENNYAAASIVRNNGRMDWGWGGCGAKRSELMFHWICIEGEIQLHPCP